MLKQNQTARNGLCKLIIGLLALTTTATQANDFPLDDTDLPAISIIIDDMGYRLNSGTKAISLPGALTYSFFATCTTCYFSL